MKLLNHPHIIKLYQVRTQVCFCLLLLASVLFSISNNLRLQFPKAALSLGFCGSRGLVV